MKEQEGVDVVVYHAPSHQGRWSEPSRRVRKNDMSSEGKSPISGYIIDAVGTVVVSIIAVILISNLRTIETAKRVTEMTSMTSIVPSG